jgi:nicotinamidase-related amidase
MASVRSGEKDVLVIVDVQVSVMDGTHDAAGVIARIAGLVEKARAKQIPIVWVQHSDADLIEGTSDWEWVPELEPLPTEPLIAKSFNSAFEETELEETLASLGATHIILVGASSNWCIRATSHAAIERGYDLTLVQDAHTTKSIELEDGRKIAAESLILELNIAMTWLAYSNRGNTTAPAEDIFTDGEVAQA